MKPKSYTFSVKPIYGKSKKKLTISASSSFSELDSEIRNVMGHDSWDHLSGFYEGKPFQSTEIATVSPDGGGENSDISIKSLNLQPGDKLGYVYDFGDCLQSTILVEEVS